MLFVDGNGRRLEVIQLDRGKGPVACINYLTTREALAFVDEETLVEVIELRP